MPPRLKMRATARKRQRMTANRAHKNAIKAARQQGESYTSAKRRLAQVVPRRPAKPKIGQAVVYGSGSLMHAVVAYGNHGRFGYGRALCGLRGGSEQTGGWLFDITFPGDDQDPIRVPYNLDRATAEDTRPRYCQDCVHRYEEEHLPDQEQTKVCSSCTQVKPLNKFRPHKGRKDGRASTCMACSREAAAARETAASLARENEYKSRRRSRLETAVAQLNAWQADPQVTHYRCAVGHELHAGINDVRGRDQVLWACDCGTAPVTKLHHDLAVARADSDTQAGTIFQIPVQA